MTDKQTLDNATTINNPLLNDVRRLFKLNSLIPHTTQPANRLINIQFNTNSIRLFFPRPFRPLQEKPHKCSLCAKSFPTPGDLKSHMYVHSGSWPFKCHICSRGFSKHTNLKNHLFLHTGKWVWVRALIFMHSSCNWLQYFIISTNKHREDRDRRCAQINQRCRSRRVGRWFNRFQALFG